MDGFENLPLELDKDEAYTLAQLVKRIGFSDVRQLAASDNEAYKMMDVVYKLQKALEEQGFAPR